MSLKTKKIITIAVIVAGLVLTVVGYLILPDTLVMQVGVSGEASRTASKLVGLGIPAVLSIGFAAAYLVNKNPEAKGNKTLLVSLVGIAAFVLTFAFNLGK